MPIVLPAGLPARETLCAEGIRILDRDQVRFCDDRPLRLCLINLMPNKAATETQIARLLGGTSIAVEIVLCLPDRYQSKSTLAEHIAFYKPWNEIRSDKFDALVVTGAPLEALPFEEVDYWSDLCAIFDWADSRAIESFYICWAAQAALYHFHGVPKHPLPEKLFGVFNQRVARDDSPLLRGFNATFPVPVSRHAEVRSADLPASAGMSVLVTSPETGLCLVEDRGHRAVYMFNHLEYDADTLRNEFVRDRLAGKAIENPRNYFSNDNPQLSPINIWRRYGRLLFENWLRKCQVELDRDALHDRGKETNEGLLGLRGNCCGKGESDVACCRAHRSSYR